jgi:transposase, IS30 family
MSYTHFTPSERNQLYAMRVVDELSISKIALEMNRSQSTISRELKRNSSNEGFYLPDTAQKMMENRRQESKEKFESIDTEAINKIKEYLKLSYSPEQLSGRIIKENGKSISYETIYQMIYADHQGLGKYKKYLRQKQKRRRRKNAKQKRGVIPNRIGIENRPKIADLKIDIGHWEGDTVIGSNHDGAIVTYVDKASKYLLAGLVKNKSIEQVNKRTIELFKEAKSDFRKTITFDNGREFCGHEEIAEELELEIFFANPYRSWERGLNEHTNGLIREFFPKGTNFKTVKEEELQKIVDLINNRPRKSLDYSTPYEIFYGIEKIQVGQEI